MQREGLLVPTSAMVVEKAQHAALGEARVAGGGADPLLRDGHHLLQDVRGLGLDYQCVLYARHYMHHR